MEQLLGFLGKQCTLCDIMLLQTNTDVASLSSEAAGNVVNPLIKSRCEDILKTMQQIAKNVDDCFASARQIAAAPEEELSEEDKLEKIRERARVCRQIIFVFAAMEQISLRSILNHNETHMSVAGTTTTVNGGAVSFSRHPSEEVLNGGGGGEEKEKAVNSQLQQIRKELMDVWFTSVHRVLRASCCWVITCHHPSLSAHSLSVHTSPVERFEQQGEKEEEEEEKGKDKKQKEEEEEEEEEGTATTTAAASSSHKNDVQEKFDQNEVFLATRNWIESIERKRQQDDDEDSQHPINFFNNEGSNSGEIGKKTISYFFSKLRIANIPNSSSIVDSMESVAMTLCDDFLDGILVPQILQTLALCDHAEELVKSGVFQSSSRGSNKAEGDVEMRITATEATAIANRKIDLELTMAQVVALAEFASQSANGEIVDLFWVFKYLHDSSPSSSFFGRHGSLRRIISQGSMSLTHVTSKARNLFFSCAIGRNWKGSQNQTVSSSSSSAPSSSLGSSIRSAVSSLFGNGRSTEGNSHKDNSHTEEEQGKKESGGGEGEEPQQQQQHHSSSSSSSTSSMIMNHLHPSLVLASRGIECVHFQVYFAPENTNNSSNNQQTTSTLPSDDDEERRKKDLLFDLHLADDGIDHSYTASEAMNPLLDFLQVESSDVERDYIRRNFDSRLDIDEIRVRSSVTFFVLHLHSLIDESTGEEIAVFDTETSSSSLSSDAPVVAAAAAAETIDDNASTASSASSSFNSTMNSSRVHPELYHNEEILHLSVLRMGLHLSARKPVLIVFDSPFFERAFQGVSSSSSQAIRDFQTHYRRWGRHIRPLEWLQSSKSNILTIDVQESGWQCLALFPEDQSVEQQQQQHEAGGGGSGQGSDNNSSSNIIPAVQPVWFMRKI